MKAIEVDYLLECLLSLGRFHDCAKSPDSLLAGLPLEDGHLSPALFSRAAIRCGLTSKVVERDLDHISKSLLPVVVLLKNDKACLLAGWSEDSQTVQVIHPELSDTAIEIPAEVLRSAYIGKTILVKPKFRFDPRTSELSKSDNGHWFWSVLKENTGLYRDVLLAAFFINLFALALPIFNMNVYDRVVPNQAFETLWMLAAGVVVILISDLILKTMRGYFLDLASKRIDIKISAKIMARVLGLRMEARPLSVGSFAANLRSFESIRDFIASAGITTIIDLPFVLLFLLVLAWISPWLTVPVLIGICIVTLFSLSTQKKMEELTETTFRASAMRNAILIESLSGLDTVKAMSAEGRVQRKWEQSASFLARVGVQLKLLSSSNGNVAAWVQQLVSVSIIIIGVYLISVGQMSMGGMIAASMLTGRAMAPLGQLAALTTQYHHVKTAYQSLNGIMEQPIERPEEANFLSRQSFEGKIEFRNVSFSYPGSDVVALKDVSFIIQPGESVAVLGRIGSGKSTLHKMIMGMYQPTEGSILVDGIDLRQLDPAELRRHMGYAPQDTTLFYGSLKDNIIMANPHATDEDVVRAAEMVNLNDYVNSHPQGFDMEVGERGDSLSGGQRKSVGLARALINEAPILLLDEPTGSMDQTTELWVKEKLTDYTQDKTVVLVTHRTPLLSLVERILVVDGGQIIADGARDKVIEALRQGRIGRNA